MPTNFEELLTGNFGDMCSVFFSLYPDNVNKEVTSLLVSIHIFLESKGIKAALMKYLKQWVYNPTAFAKSEKLKDIDELLEFLSVEPGCIEKFIELFKMRKSLRELKAELEEKDGLSNGYVYQKVHCLWVTLF